MICPQIPGSFVPMYCISVSDLDATRNLVVSGSFDGHVLVWRLPECRRALSIATGHAVNCVSVCADLGVIASCSRTAKQDPGKGCNVALWSLEDGSLLKALDLESACYVKVRFRFAEESSEWTCCFSFQIDRHKLVCLVSAGDSIIGEHHMIKWPIAKIVTMFLPNDFTEGAPRASLEAWNYKADKSEILLRYLRTPSVTCDETLLVYSQSRTRGICTVLNMWPSELLDQPTINC